MTKAELIRGRQNYLAHMVVVWGHRYEYKLAEWEKSLNRLSLLAPNTLSFRVVGIVLDPALNPHDHPGRAGGVQGIS